MVSVCAGLVAVLMTPLAWAQTEQPGQPSDPSDGAEPSLDESMSSPARTAPEVTAPASTADGAGDVGSTQPAPVESTEAQQQGETDRPPATLFGDGKYVLGGFGGVDVRYTRALGGGALWTGGEGAFLVNHALSIGLGGGSIVTNVYAPSDAGQPSDSRVQLAYGGPLLRYHFFSSQVVNVAIGGRFGVGAIVVGDSGEVIVVGEPEVGVFLNFTRWVRAGVMGTYRFVSGVSKHNLSGKDVRGASGGMTLQFGRF